MVGIIDQKDQEISVKGGVMIMENLRCIKQHVIAAEKVVKSPLNLQVASLFFAATVLRKIKMMVQKDTVKKEVIEGLRAMIQGEGVMMIEIL